MNAARPEAAVARVLAAVLVLQCAGALGIAVRQGPGVPLLGTAVALVAALVVVALRERRAAYVVAAWFFCEAAFETVAGHEPLSVLELGCHAARYGVPLAVAQPRIMVPVLRVTASLTFLGHGVEALSLEPMFIAYLQTAADLAGQPLPQAGAALLLRVIGTVDLVVGTALLVRGPRPWLTGYMTAWGTITALARVVYAGPAGIVDALVRAANGGAPLVLWLLGSGERPGAPRRGGVA